MSFLGINEHVATAETQNTEIIGTHFYKLDKLILNVPGGSTFITKNAGGNSLYMLGINESDNFKTARNAIYPISLLYSESLTIRALKDLDLRNFALSGSRIVDFEFIGNNKFGINAVITLSRNQGGGVYLCRDMIALGLKISADPLVEHRVVKEIFNTGCVPSNIEPPGILWNVLEQSGGQIGYKGIINDKNGGHLEFYLTVGDFKVLSQNKYLLNQKGIDSGQVLGRIVKINVNEGQLTSKNVEPSTLSSNVISKTCAKGIRNAQGLTIIKSKGLNVIAATSHGPRGGDTLMFIDCVKTIDYGWPNVSLGTSYTGKSIDLANNIKFEGSISSSGVPNWTWTPSIGPSTLVQINPEGKFSRWWTDSKNGTQDILMSGMAAKKLFRLRSYEGRVIGIEEIFIGERCRSLVEMAFASFICGLDSNQLLVLSYHSEWNSNNGWLFD